MEWWVTHTDDSGQRTGVRDPCNSGSENQSVKSTTFILNLIFREALWGKGMNTKRNLVLLYQTTNGTTKMANDEEG